MRAAIGLVVLVAGVAGCAMTATEIQQKGTTHALTSLQSPPTVAQCVVRTAPESFGSVMAQVRDSGAQRTDITLYYAGILAGVATIAATPTGSEITVSLWPYLIKIEENRILGAFQGC